MIQTKDSNLTFRPLTIDDAEQYNALLRYAFQVTEQELSESGWKDDEIKQSKFPVLVRADVLGCFCEEDLVSQFAVYPLDMNIYGVRYPVGFVTSVCTYPEYTGQGIMKKLMIRSLTRMRENHRSFALLYPYSIPLYRNLGWEIISNKMTYTIKDTQVPRKLKAPGYVRRVAWDDKDFKELHTKFASKTHGCLYRNNLAWEEYFRWDEDDTGSVFYTENFFSILGIPLSAELPMNIEKFREILKEYTEKNLYKTKSGSTKLYCIRIPEKGVRYVRMEVKNENWVQIGLVEDVTVSMRERLRIEHERDYDTLTGLYNRRAFKRESESIFGRRKKIRHAAFIMLDLDNLKYTNDTFGHDWGDEYIRQAGMCLEEGTPKGTLCAHISGDEFNILFYGYESQNAIRKEISKLKREISSRIIRLPDGQEFHLSISGGIAWYPEDSNSLGVMRKHADFAMYQVKQTDKGRIAEFDQKAYEEKYRDSQIRKEFHRFVKEELVTYYFQPIISAKTGKIEAYEALMRANLPILKRPDVVMKIAREEGALREIERMTMFRATEAFADLREKKRIKGDALLFINSIASQHMAAKDEIEFNNRYAELQKQIVIEITEEESIDYHALEIKRNAPGFEGAFALDDYGSGYSNEKSLLDLAPKYIKVDLSIIRDIDTDPDKQQIVENIVAYAHKRDMKIVAEGLETPEEIQKVLELEVDLLQGFYLARPEPVPGNINEDALKIIAAFYK